jgi:GNAT superfamily N-acetyltransferase
MLHYVHYWPSHRAEIQTSIENAHLATGTQMTNFGEKDRFKSQMFENGNRLRFERPVDDAGRQWWLAKFYDPFELTPEGMADRLTKSTAGSKSAVFHYIDGGKETFSLRIDGDFPGTEEFWYAQRSLDLKGSAFGADGMFVSEGAQGMGRGRALMGYLIDTAKLIDVERITLRAEKIGRYAWIKMGFLPDAGSWAHLKKDALSFILSHESLLGAALTNDLVRQVHKGGPEAARTLAFVEIPVPSRDLAARYEPPLVPFGRAFFLEIATDWHGTLDLRDEATMKLVASYRDKS